MNRTDFGGDTRLHDNGYCLGEIQRLVVAAAAEGCPTVGTIVMRNLTWESRLGNHRSQLTAAAALLFKNHRSYSDLNLIDTILINLTLFHLILIVPIQLNPIQSDSETFLPLFSSQCIKLCLSRARKPYKQIGIVKIIAYRAINIYNIS